MQLKERNKNWFDKKAHFYAVARPTYPSELFELLSERCNQHHNALDCGTGNGQSAVLLADHFEHVSGLDTSQSQLKLAEKRNNVNYIMATADQLPAKDQSIDLVTVAEAVHWFSLDDFYNETNRVLKPDGKVAVWCYYLPNISPKLDTIIDTLFHETLKDYIDDKRLLIKDGYKNLPFPFENVERHELTTTKTWSFENMLQNLYSSSQVKKYTNDTGIDPIAAIHDQLKAAWGDTASRTANWQISVLIGQKPQRQATYKRPTV